MIISNFAALLVTLVGIVLVIAVPIGAVYLLYKLVAALCWLLWRGVTGVAAGLGYGFRGVGLGTRHVWTFLRNTVVDALRMVGALLTSVFMIPPVLGSVFLGRWSAANHYGRAFERELKEVWVRLYRLAIGNPIRLVGLRALTEGVEDRLPDVMAHAPGADRPHGGPARFEGYEVTGSLPRGGSGARLYLAEPNRAKRDQFARSGQVCPGQVVIKAFSLEDGSTLPQIVRESRALAAAKELGLVLDHSLEGESFWYVMPFVEGRDLGVFTRELHLSSGDEGLGDDALREVMHSASQLLATLDRFHEAGLWHKDIKPANVIVSDDNRAHLVDFGLVTPLRSAMTLTTHGTEYFRDPEMVRLAMQGVKVHEVDGVKFDLYSMGAVLFSMIENSFPAHGSLSQITKRCPDALRWVVRRAMADTKSRYGSSRAMLADVAAILESADPFRVVPADLPSFGEGDHANQVDPERFRPSAAQPSAPTFEFRSVPADPEPKKLQRRVHRGVLAALALFTVMLLGGSMATGLTAFFDGSPHYAAAVPVGHHDASHSQVDTVMARVIDTLDRFNAEERGILSADRSCYRHENHVHHDPDCRREHTPVLASQPVSVSPSGEPFDVLIVNDLSPALSDRYLARVSDALAEADMQVRGLASDDSREIEWLAEARKLAGVGIPDDTESISRLEEFVMRNEVLDAVWWLAESEQDGVMISRFVTPEGSTDRSLAAVDLR